MGKIRLDKFLADMGLGTIATKKTIRYFVNMCFSFFSICQLCFIKNNKANCKDLINFKLNITILIFRKLANQ